MNEFFILNGRNVQAAICIALHIFIFGNMDNSLNEFVNQLSRIVCTSVIILTPIHIKPNVGYFVFLRISFYRTSEVVSRGTAPTIASERVVIILANSVVEADGWVVGTFIDGNFTIHSFESGPVKI